MTACCPSWHGDGRSTRNSCSIVRDRCMTGIPPMIIEAHRYRNINLRPSSVIYLPKLRRAALITHDCPDIAADRSGSRCCQDELGGQGQAGRGSTAGTASVRQNLLDCLPLKRTATGRPLHRCVVVRVHASMGSCTLELNELWPHTRRRPASRRSRVRAQ